MNYITAEGLQEIVGPQNFFIFINCAKRVLLVNNIRHYAGIIFKIKKAYILNFRYRT